MAPLLSIWDVVAMCFMVIGLLSAGCGSISVEDLPKEIQYVASNKNTFAQHESDPLADTRAGTVVDDLSGLDGCWGAYAIRGQGGSLQYELSRDLTWQNEVYAAYRFDASAGTGTYQSYSSTKVLSIDGASMDAFTFTVVGNNRIDMDISAHTYSVPGTGELVTYGPEDVPFPSWLWEQELLVTVSDECMKTQGSDLVYHRFDCPERPGTQSGRRVPQ